jgi:hypothetical protein
MALDPPKDRIIRQLLRQILDIAADAERVAREGGEPRQAARIKDIKHRISDEIDVTDRRLADTEREEKGAGK